MNGADQPSAGRISFFRGRASSRSRFPFRGDGHRLGAGIFRRTRHARFDPVRLTSDPRNESRRNLRQIVTGGRNGRDARAAQCGSGQDARRFSTQSRRHESGLAPRRNVSDLQHGLGVGRAAAERNWNPALVRRDPRGDPRRFFSAKPRVARFAWVCARDARRIFSRARPRRDSLRNDLVALCARQRCAKSWSRRGFGSSAALLGLISVLLAAWLPAQTRRGDGSGAAHCTAARSSNNRRNFRAVGLRAAGSLSCSPACVFVFRAHDRSAMVGIRRGLFCSRRFFVLGPGVVARFSRDASDLACRRRLEPRLAAENLGRARWCEIRSRLLRWRRRWRWPLA